MLVVASPAIWGPRCLIKGYSVVVTNTTAGIVLDSVSNWLLSYQKTFTLPRGSTLSAVITQGSGSADAEVTILPVAPSVPTSLVAPSATSTSISLQWAAPADDGGSPVTGYSVSWTGGSLQTDRHPGDGHRPRPEHHVRLLGERDQRGGLVDGCHRGGHHSAHACARAEADAVAGSAAPAAAQSPARSDRRPDGRQRREHGGHS